MRKHTSLFLFFILLLLTLFNFYTNYTNSSKLSEIYYKVSSINKNIDQNLKDDNLSINYKEAVDDSRTWY